MKCSKYKEEEKEEARTLVQLPESPMRVVGQILGEYVANRRFKLHQVIRLLSQCGLQQRSSQWSVYRVHKPRMQLSKPSQPNLQEVRAHVKRLKIR